MGKLLGRLMELAQDGVRWEVLILTVLNLCALLSKSYLIIEMDIEQIGFVVILAVLKLRDLHRVN
jgi:hypothetical protein